MAKTSFRGIAFVASDMGGPWTGWIGPAPVQMSGCCLGTALWWLCDGLLRVWLFPLTFRFSVNRHFGHHQVLGLKVLRAHLRGLWCIAAFPLIFRQLSKGSFLRTVLGYVGKRGWGVEGCWCLRKWVQWSPSIGGAKCGLITSNEKDVQGFLRLHQVLARSLPRRRSRRACVRAYVPFVCVCVCICVWVYVCRHVYMYIYACVYVYVYLYAYLCINCGFQYQCFSVWTVSCMRMCGCVHMYAYAYVCKYICMCIFLQWLLHALWNRCFGH